MIIVVIIFKLSILFLSITSGLSAKILGVFPMPAISHQIVFRPLMQELSNRGHEVTIITTDPAFPDGENPANLKEIDVHNVSYHTWQKFFKEIHIDKKTSDVFENMRNALRGMEVTFRAEFQSSDIQKLISDKNNKFDLIIMENIVLSTWIFSYIYEAPIILISSVGHIINDAYIMGIPSHPILYPTNMRRKLYNLSLCEKLKEIYAQYSFEFSVASSREAAARDFLHQTFGSTIPPIRELFNKVDMLFLNVHSVWADNQPLPPSVVYMGGLYQMPRKELPKELQMYLDSSKCGVIYFSFGTSVQSEMIPHDKLKIFLKVLSQLPYDVLLKWNTEELPGKPNNIKTFQWYPQADLLRHPKVKLFITQGGLLSTYDAITAGVPLIGFPVLGDQWYNSHKYVKHGIGKMLNLETVTEEEFKSAIETVINHDSYRENILKLRDQFLDQPETPLQRAVWWTEYVIRHGGAKHLRSPAANISYMQYFEIEVLSIIVFLLVITLAALISIFFFIYKVFKRILNTRIKIKTD